MKSNASATRMMIATSGEIGMTSAVLQDDGLEDVGDVLPHVRRRFETSVQLLPAQHVDGIVAAVVEIRHHRARDLVGFVLEPVELDGVRHQLLEVLQTGNRLLNLDAGLGDDAGELDGFGAHGLHPEQHEAAADGLRRVEHVVETAGEAVDVLALERGDEGAVELVEDLVGDEVAAVLDFLEADRLSLYVLEVLQHIEEHLAAFANHLSLLLEQREEVFLFRKQRDHAALLFLARESDFDDYHAI